MAKNYNGSFIEGENLNEEVDFDFFEEEKSEVYDPKNKVPVKSIEKEIKDLSISNAETNVNDLTENSLSKKSVPNSTIDEYQDSSFEEDTSVDSSTSLSLKSSKESSSQSENSQRSINNNNRNPVESSQSTRPTNSIADESEMTSVSSIESDSSPAEIIETTKKTKKSLKPPAQISKYHTHLKSSVDYDMIPTEVILQTMMRIHEERRLVQRMKPKWVDPNTKDYSVSGITKKLNLLPERIVSMNKNIRSNPFYSNQAEEKRLYHTAINRNKEKDRIDKENRELLYRLQNIRPSPGITKNELLKEYSKLSRFSSNSQNKPRISFRTSSCRPQSSSNSSSYLKNRPPPSSTIVSRYGDSRQSNYRKSETNSRIMSASSLTSHNSRQSADVNLKKKKRKQ